jgi:hypothetical protein
MTLGQFIVAYHTQISLIIGPLLLFVIYRGLPLPWWANLPIALAAMFYLIGLWGIILNTWAFAILFAWLASRRRGGLRVLRVFSLVVAVLLAVVAVAFYVFELFNNPMEILGNLWNPLTYVYLLPAVLMFTVASHLGEKIDEKLSTEPSRGGGAEG